LKQFNLSLSMCFMVTSTGYYRIWIREAFLESLYFLVYCSCEPYTFVHILIVFEVNTFGELALQMGLFSGKIMLGVVYFHILLLSIGHRALHLENHYHTFGAYLILEEFFKNYRIAIKILPKDSLELLWIKFTVSKL
jgi:hypothetical protein